MSGFVVGGGKIDAEGFLKALLMSARPGYAVGLNVTQRGAGANMSVDVNLGSAGFAGGLLNTSSNIPYFGWIAATQNVAVTAADPTNPRIDTVVAYVDLSVISTSITDNTGAFLFKAVAGTPAGSPTAPSGGTIQASVGAGNPYMTLANVAVAAAASSIVNANITDTRLPMAYAVPFLYGGTSNTKGHLVPNQADGTIVTTTDTNSVSAQMLATNAITLGYAEVTADQGSITTIVDLTGLTVTVTVPAGGRRIEIEGYGRMSNATVDAYNELYIFEGAGQLNVDTANSRSGSNAETLKPKASFVASAGSHTYKLRSIGNGGTATLRASATAAAFIMVKAI